VLDPHRGEIQSLVSELGRAESDYAGRSNRDPDGAGAAPLGAQGQAPGRGRSAAGGAASRRRRCENRVLGGLSYFATFRL
jgi:hypothetical protein